MSKCVAETATKRSSGARKRADIGGGAPESLGYSGEGVWDRPPERLPMGRRIPRYSAALLLLFVAATADAYQVTSNFSNPCHEMLTIAAYNGVLDDVNTERVPLPDTDVWHKLAARIEEALDIEYQSPQEQLIAVSLVIGARWPDLRGHSIANFVQLRDANLNPDGQYVHCLRGPDDDYEEGNANAVEGTKDWIREQVDAAAESLNRPPEQQIVEARFYLDFYGEFEVDVWEPAFRLGIAAHAIEDSFVHALRDADVTKINSVLNYVDPVNSIDNEERDGLPHSDSLDDCSDTGRLSALAQAARQAVGDFYAASRLYDEGDPGAIDAMLTKWMTLKPGCTIDNDYCNSPYVDIAREKLSEPYICSLSGGPITDPWRQVVLPWALILGVVAVVRIRRRTRGARHKG